MNEMYDYSDYRKMLAGQWNHELRSIRITSIIISLVLLALGVLCAIFPGKSIAALSVIASILIVVLGVFQIVCYCKLPILIRRVGTLVSGILNILLGILLLCSPIGVTLSTFIFMMGFMLISIGIEELVFSGTLKSFGVSGSGWLIANGIISILAALMFFFMPMMASVVAINYMIAAYLIVDGVTLLIEAISMKDLKAQE